MKRKPKPTRPAVPRVRIARVPGRPIQLRYTDPACGREVRITTGTHDEAEAIEQRDDLQAKLRLGIAPKRRTVSVAGPSMPWDEFRERYSEVQLATLRSSSVASAESRLNVAEKILGPRTLGDVATTGALSTLQSRLLAGDCGRFKDGKEDDSAPLPRSPHSVRSYMAVIIAALSWAHLQGWIPEVPKLKRIKASKLRHAKGRPLVLEEFERLLTKVPDVVGTEADASWKYLLRGLWSSGLRLEEIMSLSWDIPGTIQPRWYGNRHGVLEIPAAMQKNDTEESIPLLPWLEEILRETSKANRTGWVFEPGPLPNKIPINNRVARPSAAWVGKIISRIGKEANVVVATASKGRPAKFASAHDLRRSCAERLLDAGVPMLVIQRVMRHASFETTRRHYAPGTVQKDAAALKAYLGTVYTAI